MRNLKVFRADAPCRARPGSRSGYTLTSGYGRRGHVVVKRTGAHVSNAGGMALIGLGVVAVGSALAVDFSPDGQIAAMILGGQAAIVGVILRCYSSLTAKHAATQTAAVAMSAVGGATEDAHQFYWDLGYEAGWNEASKVERPVLVDLDSRRSRNKALTSARGVVDRG